MAYPYEEILFGNNKELSNNTFYNMEKPQKHYTK